MADLKPCPVCNHTQVMPAVNTISKTRFILCIECGFRGEQVAMDPFVATQVSDLLNLAVKWNAMPRLVRAGVSYE
jgi:transcription elongation factor Elf1